MYKRWFDDLLNVYISEFHTLPKIQAFLPKKNPTLETKLFAPENGWLEDILVSLKGAFRPAGLFSGAVSFREA